ncbi:helix-turn-helix domain-containing protein [Halomonas campisalis]|uniref:GlxA family transcriptional regulator n=1 Tax=Billgrantia campisalis TaxID=74661 RepID=UPI001EEFC74E|nr:helix-turn-helix domain-containing protein [Halomonas campisalis]MDR5863181.1 helix-turn-helix domain-containing protein [Halomonas campisalis]
MAMSVYPRRVSLLALPAESTGTPIHGLYETLVLADAVVARPAGGATRLFEAEIVGPKRGIFPSACGLPLEVHRAIGEVDDTDIVITASMLFENQAWVTGTHPETVAWLRRMHDQGADLCSACAGALLLAETGLLDGLDTTTHWAFAPTFRQNFPEIRLRVEELLIVTGRRGEFVMSGAASSWQDLILFLIARYVSPTAAQEIGKFLLYHWDSRSQAPFVPFVPPTDHGDGTIRQLQEWLHARDTVDVSVDDLAQRCHLPRPTFYRRFKRATGYSPVHYLQQLRVEEAKRLLESTDEPVDDISWRVGYEEAAAFRRVFKRITRLSPGEFRRKFHYPAGPPAGAK